MNSRHPFLICVAAFVLLSFSTPVIAADAEQRTNVLAKGYPEGLANLPPESQKAALQYVTSWMSVISTLSVSGLKKTDSLKKAYDKELLPLIEPLKNGSKFERDAFNAGTKIYETFHYVGAKLAAGAEFDNPELNALIRYEKGDETVPSKLSAGMGELLFDYHQLVAPALFEEMQRQIKSQSR